MGGSIARGTRLVGRLRGHSGLRVAMGLVLGLLLIAAPGAAAAPSFTWTGEVARSEPDWSSAANWASDTAPAPFSTVGALDFPAVGAFSCTPEEVCPSDNDVNGLTVESMQIDDREDYEIFGAGITLGSGGLSAAPVGESNELTLAAVGLPIALSASQTWNIGGAGVEPNNDLYLGGGVTGSSADELAIDVGSEGAIDFGGDNELGPVAVNGSNPGRLGFENGIFGLFGAGINAADGEPVSLNHIFFYGAGGVGALTTTDSEIYLAIGGSPPEGTLEAASATFDPASEVAFEIAGAGSTPGGDYSRLLAHGAVELGAAYVVVSRTNICSTLPVGRVYTLVSTTGQLSGAFGNAPEGGEIPIEFARNCGAVSQKLRLAYSRSGPTQTVTGTVIAGASSVTTLSSSPSTPATNQSVQLTATVNTTQGPPTGFVEFQDDGAAIPGCASQLVSGSTAVCQTAFSAASSPEHLTAVFTPATGVNLEGSTSETDELMVATDATATGLQISSATPLVGASTSYTATVKPADIGASRPSGSVEFLDDGAPIGSCSHQSLGGSSATCSLSYSATGVHSITARYPGDTNFGGSSSTPAQMVTVLLPAPVVTPPVEPPPVAKQQVEGFNAESGGITLTSTTIAVQRGGVAAVVKLHCTAPRGCHGTLSLAVQYSSKAKSGQRHTSRGVTLGVGSFSIAAGKTAMVKIKLDAPVRALLRSDHGRLLAHLTIIEVASGQDQTRFKSVHIVEQRASGSGKKRS